MHPSQLKILFEDKHLMVVNKPHNIIVEPTADKKYALADVALDYIKSNDQWPWKCYIGVPHRLDRPVSGAVVFAKKRSVMKMMRELFTKREVQKTYLAIVQQRPPQDEQLLVHWLVKDNTLLKARLYDEEVPDSARAELVYRVVDESPRGFLVEVKLITGKYHQIRAQLASVGSIIVGDFKYGSQTQYGHFAICLHAKRIAFKHPIIGEELNVEAPVPLDDWWGSFPYAGQGVEGLDVDFGARP